jgi:phosphotransacetylase
MGGAKVAGLLWGTKCPIILTSRSDSEEAKYVSICICSLSKIKNCKSELTH